MRHFYPVILAIGMVSLFQNCKVVEYSKTGDIDQSSERSLGKVANYSYEPSYNPSEIGATDRLERINIDLVNERIIAKIQNQSAVEISLSSEEKDKLHLVFEDLKECNVIPAGPGEARCMALAIPEHHFSLETGETEHLADHSICGEAYLCLKSSQAISNFFVELGL